MNKQGISVKTIVAIGIGAAVFVILGRFVVIPTGFPNTNLETSYAFLALISVIFGPFAGFMIGLIGHAVKDFTTYGSAWWSWVICSGIIGFYYGWIGQKINLATGQFSKKGILYFIVSIIIGNIVCWGLIAPILDILIYSEPANKVFTQGIISTILNIVSVGIIGTLLIKAYASTQVQKGSLRKD
ncbi:ECF-type riboflavin transporter substrate-binding protein [Mammaliicoccus sciuri]|uniref:ECF-type riboflavin transporter substrate-binding protein n=1 Tax=Mammaliicoccus sciuri TaxID=1296 RepID=UPI0021CF4DBD|nr:ECF-type riboflavin transporter substrate-binding protein [Mammaliicoccus sciuri]UXU84025.1 ECF-type riboflavin transporter substrate-binding protein [Mammaliicoccus sciuri]UXU93872.1 ECF-type riboflavin transporter substrate-binding protein [Mammaliicoccus sciuri]UXV15822.1 ECF-type riboflavin transporter substrate-binding protein [Mammaliicoccus sciuri]UXV24082.1 ECF-type riboflavin transporter substrate-binding protein [Mammaliicoccus sciuri]UXV26865.1 ECF-type riboflavin transporter sub